MPALRGKTSPQRSSNTAVVPSRLLSSPSNITSSLSSSPIDPNVPSSLLTTPYEFVPASRRRKGPDHIPRPPNAFILFRQHVFKQLKERTVEDDQRLFSQIVSTTWAELTKTQKVEWYDMAAKAKAAHAEAYPNYRFSPVVRTDKPRKRNVKRNGPEDKARCRHLGMLIAQQWGPDALAREAKRLDTVMRQEAEVNSLKSAHELGIPISENYTTTIFDATPCESLDASVVSTPLPSTPRRSAPRPGIPTHSECSPTSTPSFCAPPRQSTLSIDAFASRLHTLSRNESANFEPPSTPPRRLQPSPIKESPKPEREALFLASTPSPPPYLSVPAHKLAPKTCQWTASELLPEVPGMDDDKTWYGPSTFDDASVSSSPSASSPSMPCTPPQHFRSPFLPSPTIASSPIQGSPFAHHMSPHTPHTSPFALRTRPFAIPALEGHEFGGYPGGDMYADALSVSPHPAENVWLGGLLGIGDEGQLRGGAEGTAKGEKSLGLYESLMEYTNVEGYTS